MTKNPPRSTMTVFPISVSNGLGERLHFPASFEAGGGGHMTSFTANGMWATMTKIPPLHLALKPFQDTFLSLPCCNDAGIAPNSHLNPRSFTDERIKSDNFQTSGATN